MLIAHLQAIALLIQTSSDFTGQSSSRVQRLIARPLGAPVASQNLKPVSFVNDVIPSLSRLGCNTGACHGAQQGKGGFALSLRGYAPEMDFVAITRALGGRRISRALPSQSLFLRKPLLEVVHRGGRRLVPGGREHRLLREWLAQGAPGPMGSEPTLVGLTIRPGDREMKPGQTQELAVIADFSDGVKLDVTRRAVFASNDVGVAVVNEKGVARMLRPGETAITARYMNRLAAVRVLAPYRNTVRAAAFSQRRNNIDDYVNAKLRQLNIEPSGGCTDEEFLRRAYVDVLGTLPTVDEARTFLDSRDGGKREALLDSLLARPEYGMVWALKYGDLFVLRREYLKRKNAMLLQQWLMEQFNANRPWDQVATAILTASGELDSKREGLFFVSRVPQKPGERYWIRSPEATSEMVAQVFLGSRIQCAKCHNHPSERYTQDDYYRFASLWQQVGGKGGDTETPVEIVATASGEVRQPRTGNVVEPQPLDRSNLFLAKDEDRRAKATAWIVRQDEFARAMVNRIWARCFGTGIIEPVDDVRSTNPASNEPLMRAMVADFRASKFDVKRLMKTIMQSAAYQRSARSNSSNRSDTRYFSHYPARRLPAEELADAVSQVTGVPDRFSGMPLGTRACELADTEIPSIMLDTFGRPPRVMPSDTERICSPAISQALALLNGPAIQDKLKASDGALAALLASKQNDAEIIETLYLAALARRPSARESASLSELIKQAPSRDEGFQDVLWALLNSKEFIFNH